jgi:N-acetylneuraminate synthase
MMFDFLTIQNRAIGMKQPCFIIAEAGVNHNGDMALAKQLIDAAQTAGADAVKFQTWITEKLVTQAAPMAEYQQHNLQRDDSQFAMLKELELSQSVFRELKTYAEQRGILFFSTPDEEDSADFLEALGVPLFKIGSGEVTNVPFLRHIAAKNKPMILSTGMSYLYEVEQAVRTIESTGNQQLFLLHCVSNYPAQPEECNLHAMDTLRQAFQYPVGFSDHTMGIEVAIAAVAQGACIIEKHLTLDKTLPGPDHAASLDAAEFAHMVRAIRLVEAALGSGRKAPTASELETRKVVQKSIVAKHALSAGTVLTAADVALRRAGNGLPARYLEMLIGKTLRRDLAEDEILSMGDVV